LGASGVTIKVNNGLATGAQSSNNPVFGAKPMINNVPGNYQSLGINKPSLNMGYELYVDGIINNIAFIDPYGLKGSTLAAPGTLDEEESLKERMKLINYLGNPYANEQKHMLFLQNQVPLPCLNNGARFYTDAIEEEERERIKFSGQLKMKFGGCDNLNSGLEKQGSKMYH
jgi:hypothetical protein